MSTKLNVPTGSKPSVIETAQHQFGFELNINHSSAQRRRTQIMLENIQRSKVLIDNKDLNNFLDKKEMVLIDLKLKK